MKKSYLLCIVICTIVLSSIIQFGNIVDFKLYIFEASIVSSALLSFFLFKLPKKILIISFFFLPVIIFSIINSILENSPINFISISFYFISIILCVSLGANLDKNSFFRLLSIYIVINLIFHISGLISANTNNVYNVYNGYSGVFTNPNFYGLFSSFSFVFVYLAIISNNLKLTLPIYIYLLINISGVLLSVSRNAVLCLFVSITAYYLLLYIRRFRFKVSKNFFIIAILLSSIVCLSFYFGIFDIFLKKNEALGDDLSSGRFDLWLSALNSLRFYGYGESYYQSGELATHNNYLNIGVVFGGSVMVSLLFFWLSIFIYLLYGFKRYNSKNILFVLCILIYGLLYWMFEVGSSFFFVWLIFVTLGYSYANFEKRMIV